MSCLVAFHYRSYGTFFLHKNRLHNIYRGFTHYKYYRAFLICLTVVNFLWIEVVLEEALFCQTFILSSRLTVVVVGVD